MTNFGPPATGGRLGGAIFWLARRPPPRTTTSIPSGTITVTVPNRLKTSSTVSVESSRAWRRSRSTVPKIERHADRRGNESQVREDSTVLLAAVRRKRRLAPAGREVTNQSGQLDVSSGCVGEIHALAELLERQPTLGHSVAQSADAALALRVGGKDRRRGRLGTLGHIRDPTPLC